MNVSARVASWLAAVVFGFGWAGALCGAQTPAAQPRYLRQATWQDTMLASLEALNRSGLEDGFAPFESETLRGGQPAQRVSIGINGAKELYLFVTGCPDVKWGVAARASLHDVGRSKNP